MVPDTLTRSYRMLAAYIVVGLVRLGNVELMLLFLPASLSHKPPAFAILMGMWREQHDSYTP